MHSFVYYCKHCKVKLFLSIKENDFLYAEPPIHKLFCPVCNDNYGVFLERVTVKILQPTYRLSMTGTNHQFMQSAKVYNNAIDAEMDAQIMRIIWGHPVKVEEVSE